MDMTEKRELDEIIKLAPMMAALTNSAVVMAAAFCVARDMADSGDDEGAMYLLKNHPLLHEGASDEEDNKDEDNFFKSLLTD